MTNQNSAFAREYCKRNQVDYAKWTHLEGIQLTRLFWLIGLLLVIMSFLNNDKHSDIVVLCAYIPGAIVAFVGSALANTKPHLVKNSALWVDTCSAFTSLGGGLVISEFLYHGIPVVNAPAQVILLFTGLFALQKSLKALLIRVGFFTILVSLPAILCGFGASFIFQRSFIAQLFIGIIGHIIASLYMKSGREIKFFAHSMRETERQLIQTKHESDITNLERKMIEEKISLMLRLADKINSPLTTVRAVSESLPKVLIEVIGALGLSKVEVNADIEAKGAALMTRVNALKESADRLIDVMKELNEARESNLKINHHTLEVSSRDS
jgi:hypothetical protein